MTREQAIEIAVGQARILSPTYCVEPFHPHEWVIAAIREAARVALDERYQSDAAHGDDS